MQTIFRCLACRIIAGAFLLVCGQCTVCAAQSAVNFGGSVRDSRTQTPISSARVILEIWSKSEPVTTFTNASGIFSFTILVNGGTWPGRIIVSDPNYQRLETAVNVSPDSKPVEILLKPLVVSSTIAESRTVVSPPMRAFPGSNWSGWTEICSSPLNSGEQAGATLIFDLVGGDRKCGAWSECRETVHDGSRICWQFRIQGHDEWRNRGPFGEINNYVGPPNAGRLVYEVLHTQNGPPPESQVGYVTIQFSGKEHDGLMLALKSTIEKKGIRAIGLERIDKNYASTVKYFHEEDKALAEQILAIVTDSISLSGVTKPVLQAVEWLENKVRLHYTEIWLH
jgi:hypothetical protein